MHGVFYRWEVEYDGFKKEQVILVINDRFTWALDADGLAAAAASEVSNQEQKIDKGWKRAQSR